MEEFKLVILESPYAGDIKANVDYAQKCMADCLRRGEAPYASHLLYTQPNVLDDSVPSERGKGISAGFAWKHLPSVHTVFYTDRGVTRGMQMAIDYCYKNNMTYEFRILTGY